VVGDYNLPLIAARLSQLYQQKRLSGLTAANWDRKELVTKFFTSEYFKNDKHASEKQAVMGIIFHFFLAYR
jgi:hypothetical protein